jgi:DNA repair protein SbcD/Mre11
MTASSAGVVHSKEGLAMAKESFRFIHASDFHLERALQDILDLPENLRKTLVEAPWKAAEAVFEHAVVENVDFILLVGDLLNPATSGAQGIAFLTHQFELLRDRGIQVYWVGGVADDPDRWPEAVSLPDNVHLFSKRQVETFVFKRHQIRPGKHHGEKHRQQRNGAGRRVRDRSR